MSASQKLHVGDLVRLSTPPFAATWLVEEIIDAGARLRYIGDVEFVGYGKSIAGLTTTPEQGFIGRAHWASVKTLPRVTSPDRPDAQTVVSTGGGIFRPTLAEQQQRAREGEQS